MTETAWQAETERERDLIAFFEDLHRHPERSGAEFRTTERIVQALDATYLEVLDTGLATGVVALLPGTRSDSTVVLRADIDALPIGEQTGLPYSSANPGVHHACGHDYHATALLGAALELAEQSRRFPFDVLFVFQPAEETATGANSVIRTGVLAGRRIRAFLGLHVSSALADGEIGMGAGPISAGVDRFAIVADGIGAHAARPHLGSDVNTTLAELVLALQTVVARRVDPFSPAVVSVTRISSGTTWNVLPESGELEGTVRTFDAATRTLIHDEILRIVRGAELATGVKLALQWDAGPGSVVNDPGLVDIVRGAALARGFAVVEPPVSGGGEDFSAYLEHGPGAFFLVPSGTPVSNHNSMFAASPRGIHRIASLHVEILTALAAQSEVPGVL